MATEAEAIGHGIAEGVAGVLVGANAVIIEGVHVGKGAVVAAGAVVINDGKVLDPKYIYLLKKKVSA